MSDHYLSFAGINEEINGIVPLESIKTIFLANNYEKHQTVDSFTASLERSENEYGSECVQPYLEPFSRIQEIPNEYIDSFLNTLCYFYPDFIGDYFKMFISGVQRMSREFLNTRVV